MNNTMEPFIVNRVSFEYTRLLDSDNQFHQSIKTYDARMMAQRQGMDLVCFSLPKGNEQALCKIIDYGKWKYHNEKELKKQMRANKSEIKTIRFSPNIAEHDIAHKVRQAKEFLERGDHVVFEMVLTGRQKQFFDLANTKMNEILACCKDCGKEVSRKRTSDTIIVHMSKIGSQEKQNGSQNNDPVH